MMVRTHHAGCCGHNPTRPDGSEWAHVLTLHDGSVVYADTPAEVLDELPGCVPQMYSPRNWVIPTGDSKLSCPSNPIYSRFAN